MPPRTGALRPLARYGSAVVNLHGRSLAAVVPAALALIAPAAAGAACARSVEQLARQAPVVVTAKAQPGPVARNGVGLLAPATFKVVAYDQGSGPRRSSQTALTEGAAGLAAISEGVNPIGGQTWRLWGTLGADGVLQTTCARARRSPGCSRRRRWRPGAAPPRCAPRPSRRRRTPVAADADARRAAARSSCACQRARRTSPCPQPAARAIVAVRVRRGATTTSLAEPLVRRRRRAEREDLAPASGTATIVVITRRRVVRGAAASRLSFSARVSALMRASSRRAAVRSGIAHEPRERHRQARCACSGSRCPRRAPPGAGRDRRSSPCRGCRPRSAGCRRTPRASPGACRRAGRPGPTRGCCGPVRASGPARSRAAA